MEALLYLAFYRMYKLTPYNYTMIVQLLDSLCFGEDAQLCNAHEDCWILYHFLVNHNAKDSYNVTLWRMYQCKCLLLHQMFVV